MGSLWPGNFTGKIIPALSKTSCMPNVLYKLNKEEKDHYIQDLVIITNGYHN